MNSDAATPCLSDEVLERWATGGAEASEIREWEGHLVTCSACLKRLSNAYRNRCVDEAFASSTAQLASLLQDAIVALGAPSLAPNADAVMAAAPQGHSLAGRFVPTRFIAEGGMGEVYLGIDRDTGGRVAIKRLRSDLRAAGPRALERFAREGEILAQLEHPNIVKTLAVVPGPSPAIVMEFVAGGSLRQHLRSQPLIPLQRALRMLLELSDALSRAHHIGVIHRDIKPENVLLTECGTPRLTDFGLACMGAHELTSPGAILGTLPYVSPEVVQGHEADERSDLWSLGVLIFEMLSGSRPFQAGDIAGLLGAITTRAIPDLAILRPDAPISFVDLVHRLLERDPGRRLRSARLLGAELEAISLELRNRNEPTSGNGLTAVAPSHSRSAARRHNLPLPTTTFVGRELELARLSAQLVDPELRLLTIVGPGGVGKSRLAFEACQRLLKAPGGVFSRGVFLVDLTPLTSAELVAPAVAEALGFQFSAVPEPSAQILDYLRNKQLLLLMDNFEHVLPAAELVNRLLLNAVDVKVLATSREPLGLSAEVLLPLSGLSVPDAAGLEVFQHASASRLFLDTARRVQPGLTLNVQRGLEITRICRAVQGMPLGILLAAALSRSLSTQEIAEEVERNLDFLHSERVDLPQRQHSLRAVFEHSWRLLAPGERAVLASVSLFRGGFTRAAAEAVAAAQLSNLAGLVNKSLLNRDPDSGRYYLHELVRQFAEAKLHEDHALHAQTLRNYVDYYARFLSERSADAATDQRHRVLRELEAERGNLRWSWRLMLGEPRLDAINRAIDGLWLFHEERSSRREAESELAALIKRCEPLPADADLLARRVVGMACSACAAWCDEQGRNHEAGPLLRRALELLDANVHVRERARALVLYGSTQLADGLPERIAAAEKGVLLYRSLTDVDGLIWALDRLGWIHADGIDGPGKAIECLRESIAVQRAAPDRGAPRPATLAQLGACYWRQGDKVESYRLVESAVQLARELDDHSLDSCLQSLARMQRDLGDYAAAELTAREALALARERGRRIAWRQLALGDVLKDQQRLDEAEEQYEACLSKYPGDVLCGLAARYNLGDLALLRGQLGDARRLSEESLLGFQQAGVGWGIALALDNLAAIARRTGDHASARQHCADACQTCLTAHANDMLIGIAAGIAQLYAEMGLTVEAQQLLGLIDCQPLIPAHVHTRRIEPLRATLGAAVPAPLPGPQARAALDLRAELERCMRQLRS